MSFEVKDITVNSTDNIHTLVGRIFIPEGEIKGILHIVHGMTEYIGRYEHLMAYAAENGYIAFGYDNLGHGKTAQNDSELGFISHRNGWKYLVNDVEAFGSAVNKLFPDKPMYLMGHSMGSFIVRLAALSQKKLYKKLIICGTGGKNPLSLVGLMLTAFIKAFKGEKYISKFIIAMAFGAYNKRFSKNSKYNWLTSDEEIIKKYEADKFCSFDFTVSAMYDLIKLQSLCNKREWYKELDKDLLILLISGDCDPVGNYGKGVKQVYNELLKNNSKACLKLYKDCRHEILNDSCKAEVMSDILNFIKN